MKVIFFLTFLSLLSCMNEPNVKNKDEEKAIKKHESIETNKVLTMNDFRLFYNEFRNTLINQNYHDLKKMVNFPLEVWGHEDNDPHIKINENEFELYLKFSMNTSIDVDVITNQSISTFDLIKRNEYVDSLVHFNEKLNYQEIGSFYFSLVNSQWKLTQIYADTKRR
jgi:hypothetical protein